MPVEPADPLPQADRAKPARVVEAEARAILRKDAGLERPDARALGAGYELDSPTTAKTVRVRGGETIVTDGPFAETKEQIGGVMELNCEDLDQAIAIAARIPVVFRASVELRPVIEH